MQHKTPQVSTVTCELHTREHGAVKGKQHKDPRKGTVGPGPFEDQADTSPHELCKAVNEIKISLRILNRKEKNNRTIQ